ncbi:beta-N-acetylglucosaminidase domain-containing protein [Gilvimarinus polysaccharolyticus]|uniref:beta-N-acetylglucosaminidase domain-containing protein n=1 Tax=Gilvimarinus polysaccharolyticus TaxID=863921 RepID=UPI0006733645|nr:beta-N-acetylglucosaminidase domain-containing protein [Gilvimarinus polysaccharolyticus]
MINNTPLGVIEGFFGRSWSWQQRTELATFLQPTGYGYYLYAPKSDTRLRSQWRQDWSQDDWQALCTLRQHYRTTGIEFGIGLSPLDLCAPNGRTDSVCLSAKIDRINQLQPDILALLFDDMRGDIPQLATIQTELAHRVAASSNASKIILCPTYYSDDPILEKVFGARPSGYWEALGQQLDSSIDIFWTGPKVCTEQFTRSHLSDVANRLQRQPFLWDNYPVNDGATKSKHLYLKPFGSDRADIGDLLAGHAVNPMNQFNLSKLALASLPHAYTDASYQPDRLFNTLLEQLCPPALGAALQEDAARFTAEGLDAIEPEVRASLAQRYRQLVDDSGMSAEVADWLAGKYSFDPACLTD